MHRQSDASNTCSDVEYFLVVMRGVFELSRIQKKVNLGSVQIWNSWFEFKFELT